MSEEIKQLNEKIDFLTDQVMSVTSRLKAFDELKAAGILIGSG